MSVSRNLRNSPRYAANAGRTILACMFRGKPIEISLPRGLEVIADGVDDGRRRRSKEIFYLSIDFDLDAADNAH